VGGSAVGITRAAVGATVAGARVGASVGGAGAALRTAAVGTCVAGTRVGAAVGTCAAACDTAPRGAAGVAVALAAATGASAGAGAAGTSTPLPALLTSGVAKRPADDGAVLPGVVGPAVPPGRAGPIVTSPRTTASTVRSGVGCGMSVGVAWPPERPPQAAARIPTSAYATSQSRVPQDDP
jgi:hypothetical protein